MSIKEEKLSYHYKLRRDLKIWPRYAILDYMYFKFKLEIIVGHQVFQVLLLLCSNNNNGSSSTASASGGSSSNNEVVEPSKPPKQSAGNIFKNFFK